MLIAFVVLRLADGAMIQRLSFELTEMPGVPTEH